MTAANLIIPHGGSPASRQLDVRHSARYRLAVGPKGHLFRRRTDSPSRTITRHQSLRQLADRT